MKLLKYPEDGRYAGFYHMIEKKQIDSGNWGAFRDQNIIQNLVKQKIKH